MFIDIVCMNKTSKDWFYNFLKVYFFIWYIKLNGSNDNIDQLKNVIYLILDGFDFMIWIDFRNEKFNWK